MKALHNILRSALPRLCCLFAVFCGMAFVLCLVSCYDPIFYKIENEVELEDANIQGEIHDIVRFTNSSGDFIFIDNGQARYKNAADVTNSSWTNHTLGIPKLEYDYYDSEFKGVQVTKVACDESCLYALGVEYEVDEDEGENVPKTWILYTSQGPGKMWQPVWSLSRSTYGWEKKYLRRYGVVSLFCTNTYNKANRKAYLRVSVPNLKLGIVGETKVYALNGDDDLTEATGLKYINSEGANEFTNDAVYFAGDVYLISSVSTYGAIATDETPDEDARHIYYSMNNAFYYSEDGTKWSGTSPGTSNGIISIALTKDFFIFGTAGSGLFRVPNTDGVPVGRTIDFTTNADAALGEPYTIRALYCMDPSKKELEATIYATADFDGTSSGSMDDIGLWSYYPYRGNWNRE